MIRESIFVLCRRGAHATGAIKTKTKMKNATLTAATEANQKMLALIRRINRHAIAGLDGGDIYLQLNLIKSVSRDLLAETEAAPSQYCSEDFNSENPENDNRDDDAD